MELTIYRWMHFLLMIIIYTDQCNGQISLVPETVPFVNEPWILKCNVDPLTSAVSIRGPSGTTIGFCSPSAHPIVASCTPNPGYSLAINEILKTVTLTRTLINSDNGTWICEHSGITSSYVLQSLISRNFPQTKSDYFDHAMTASPGIEIDTADPDYTFTFHYGCISTNLKFKWTTVPGVPWDDTSNTASTDLTCNTNQALKSTQLTSVILPKVTQDGSKLKVSVYVDGYDNVQAVEEYTFNVTFSASSPTTTPPEMSSTTKAKDQTTSSQNPSTASSHSEKADTTVMTTTDSDLTSSSLHVSSEVTTPIKTESDNLTDLSVSAIIAIAISGFIFLSLIIILIICCYQYYRKKSKKKTSEEFQEIHDDVVPKIWPNFNSHRYGLNEINGSSVHLARGYNLYQGEHNRGYNFRSNHQSDHYNRSRSDRKIITEKRKHKQKQRHEKIGHGFPQSIPEEFMNRHDINGTNTYDLHDNNQNTRTYYRGHAVSSPRRFDYRGSFFPHEYIRSSPYMTYLQEHVPRHLEGLTFYQGHNGATNKHSRRS